MPQAIADLGDSRAEIATSATGEFPIPPDALRLVLRNLLANAVAAGAERIHVSALAAGDQRILVVDDDGVGLATAERYATGRNWGYGSAVGSSNAAAAGSSSGRERSAERAP